MTFQHPEILYALFAILIPILIHLFNFRRYKKLLFSNIEFLKNITVQTRKQNQLKHLIVMFLRILAITFIVLAFAGPEWRKESASSVESSGLSVIYVDNSFSMMAEGMNGRLFDQAINFSREIIRQSPPDMRFILISNQFSASSRLATREEAATSLDDMEVSPESRPLSTVIGVARRLAEEKEYTAPDIYLLSDFQKSAADIRNLPADSLSNYFLLPFEHAQKRNIYVDSCWTTKPVILPGKPFPLMVRIKTASESAVEKVPVKVNLNGQQKALAGVDIAAGSFIDQSFTITPTNSGWQLGLIEIEDYPITFDDHFYFSFLVSESINVLEITGERTNNVLSRFYGSDSVFRFNRVNYRQVNFNSLKNNSLIILNALPEISSGLSSQLKLYLEKGGNVVYIPGGNEGFNDENAFLRNLNAGTITGLDTAYTRVSGIRTDHELFRDAIEKLPDNANLPDVFKHFRIQYSINSGLQSLLTLLDGDDLLLTKSIGSGRFYLFSVGLSEDYGNFATHPLFVPVFYGAAVGAGVSRDLYYTIGQDNSIEAYLTVAETSERPFILKKRDSEYSFIPEQRRVRENLLLNLRDGIDGDGIYELMMENTLHQTFAFNYDRKESDLAFVDATQLPEAFANQGIRNLQLVETDVINFSEALDTLQKESDLWKLFIIFALLMLLAETLILRLWK